MMVPMKFFQISKKAVFSDLIINVATYVLLSIVLDGENKNKLRNKFKRKKMSKFIHIYIKMIKVI